MTTEIKFKRDTQFRNGFFTSESFAHPAKMDAQLLIWIVEKFTSPGETILDPMFGSGTTMLACTIGRHVIGVELEQKFVRMAEKNWEKVKQRPQLGYEMGNCQVHQGDARNLNGLLADRIVTSPPYAGSEQIDDRKLLNDIHLHTRQSPIRLQTYGSIDKVITSPPYEASVNVPESKPEVRAERLIKAGYDPRDYQGGHGRNLQQDWNYTSKVDSIVTSPPYEGTESRDRSAEPSFHEGQEGIPRRGDVNLSIGYSHSDENIGNLKGQTYLDAMLQVYCQCYAVLKPDGLMILVTKNFIRNKTEIRLDLDTIKLCEQSGFTFQERYYRKLSGQSFWRTIYQQKYPDAPVLDKEDVLVFRK